jgi:5'-methylthioadenosine phosphorylase
MVTDYDCWKEGEETVTWEMIVEVMKDNSENAKKLLSAVISKID